MKNPGIGSVGIGSPYRGELKTLGKLRKLGKLGKEEDMVKGFRDFIMRGNVVDLAIAVVIGAAFGGVVTQLTKSFIEPLIKLVGGGGVHGGAFIVNKSLLTGAPSLTQS